MNRQNIVRILNSSFPTVWHNATKFGGVLRNLQGMIEAETYNNGDAGIAYHDNTPTNSGWAYNYRNHSLDMDYIPDNKGISVNTDSEEWLSYLVYVSEEAFYTPIIIASAQRNGTGILRIYFVSADRALFLNQICF